MNLYTSDLHFGHKNVIQFDHRPFSNVEEMDAFIMQCWNKRVQPDDIVYILGDLCHRSEKEPSWYLKRLKGHKILIVGNHDGKLLKNQVALSYFDRVEDMMEVEDGENHLCLCHYPIAEWNGYFRKSWHVYGHIHNKKEETYDIMKKKERALNAGCMINNYSPASLIELVRNNTVFQEK